MKIYHIIFICLGISIIGCEESSRENQSNSENGNHEQQNINDSLQSQSIEEEFSLNDKIFVYEKLNFGNGYNSATLKEYLNVIDYKNLKESTELIANASGSSGYVEVNYNETKTAYRKSLNLSLKAELDFVIDGLKSDSDYKKTIYKETKIDNLNQNVVVKSIYVNEPIVLLNAKMKKEILDLAAEDEKKFMKKYGDMFVTKIYTGGELYANFSLSKYDETHKKEVTEWVKSLNTYGDFKLSGEWESRTTVQNISNTLVKDIKVFTQGGAFTKSIKNSEQLIDAAFEFKSKVYDAPVVLFVELSPYESLPGFPESFDFSDIRIKQKNYLDKCLELFDRIDRSLSSAQNVTRLYNKYSPFKLKQADSVIQKYSQIRDTVQAFCENCIYDFETCEINELDRYNSIPLFEPTVDFPYNIKHTRDLSIIVDEEVPILDNTYPEANSYALIVDGHIQFSLRDSPNTFNVTTPNYLKEKRYVGKERRNVPVAFGKKRKHIKTYEEYSRPYYEIIYRNKDTKEFISSQPWTGTPVNLVPNVSLSIRLVNPQSRLVNSGGGLIRRISPYYSSTSVSQGGPKVPRVIVSNNNSGEKINPVNKEPLFKTVGAKVFSNAATSTLNQALILKNGYWVYDNYDFVEE